MLLSIPTIPKWGHPLRVAFFDDRIEIENPGILLPGLTVEDLQQGVSKIRNRVIARIFRELNLIEQWGSGIRRIFKEAETSGLPLPEIIEVGMRVRFIVYLAKPISRGEIESGAESEMIMQILNHLNNGILSKKEITSKLGKENPSGYLNSLVRKLVKEGYLEYKIPEKPNSRLQKYRIKEKGRICIDENGK